MCEDDTANIIRAPHEQTAREAVISLSKYH